MTLFDTDILIDAGRSVPAATAALARYASQGPVGVSAVVEMELIVGCQSKRELEAVDSFLRRFEVFNVTQSCSQRAVALLRAFRLSHGLLIPDALIAATALERDLPLVSKNQKDFRFIAGLKLEPYP